MTEIHISTIAAFSTDLIVHRAFDHLLAAGSGSLLAVPVVLAAGDLRQVVDGCPVPWEEVWAVIDTPISEQHVVLPHDQVWKKYPSVACLVRSSWRVDRIPAFAAGRVEVVRLSHDSGIRFAKV